MRFIDIMRISVRMLRTNLLRSLLTILGIGVAISLIVTLIGLGYGLQNITVGSIVESKTLLSIDIRSLDESEGSQISATTTEEIKTIPGIREVTPVVITEGEIKIDDQLAAIAISAADATYLDMEGVLLKGGGNAYADGTNEIVVTPKVLELLDLAEEGVIGGNATITYTLPGSQEETKTIETTSIVGVTSSGETEAAIVYMPYDLITNRAETKPTFIKAVAEDRQQLVGARDKLLQKGYLVETLVETLDQARTVFGWITVGLGVFGTIALVVASIGMFNTLTISLLERTREIGIMKAIGVSDKAVRRLFLTEAGLIGFGGGVAGVSIGLLIDAGVSTIVNQFAIRYGGLEINLFQYPLWFLPSIVLFPILLALATGLYPAIRAANLNPLRALRYE